MQALQSDQKPRTVIYYSLAFGSLLLIPLLLTMFGPASWGAALLVISWLYLVAALGLIMVWLFRRKWAGGVLLKLPSYGWGWQLVGVPVWIFMLIDVLLYPSQPESDRARKILLLAISFLSLIVKNEVRRDGFLIQGFLIRWSRIDSWFWQEAEANLFLKLVLNRQFKFLPTCDYKFKVQPSQKEELEAILGRHCTNSQEFSSKATIG